ncbi:MAG: tRNA pseudouridine(38-40) synthase TruA [Lachnospiraceae bacterium]
MVKNYKMVISYDGTRYFGWERQAATDMTIQGKIESVLSKMTEKEVTIQGAGRTDAGVHARGMVANARLDTDKTVDEIRDYMNHYLPDDICILEIKKAGDRFHSRYNAMGKTYCYTCYTGKLKPVFDRKYVTILDETPDVEKMRQAASLLVGTHDFASFCGNPKMKKSTVRKIFDIQIQQNGPYLTMTYHGSGFLQYMVRILSGTLLEVGFGKRTPESMTKLLEARKRALAGATAPARGLCLLKVDYDMSEESQSKESLSAD